VLWLLALAAIGCCMYQQALSTCPLNHTVIYDISSAPVLFDALALKTARLL